MIALALVTVAAGGAGAVLRYFILVAFAPRSTDEGIRFPWAVLIVNVVGSAIAGAVLGVASHAGVTPETQVVLLAGVCGGLTTFSTFSVETVQLVREGKSRWAVTSVAANVVVGIAACALAFVVFGGAANL